MRAVSDGVNLITNTCGERHAQRRHPGLRFSIPNLDHATCLPVVSAHGEIPAGGINSQRSRGSSLGPEEQVPAANFGINFFHTGGGHRRVEETPLGFVEHRMCLIGQIGVNLDGIVIADDLPEHNLRVGGIQRPEEVLRAPFPPSGESGRYTGIGLLDALFSILDQKGIRLGRQLAGVGL